MHPTLAGIRCNEPPLEACSHDIDDKLTSSAVSALNTMAITWDKVKLATTSDKDLTQLVSIIGFWLFQKHCECASKKPFCCPTGWKIALVGSRFTHPAESLFAPVEGEALAVADALDKARFFVQGCNDLIIAVDHKPLLKIFSDWSLEEISNSRIHNLKLRYRFQMKEAVGPSPLIYSERLPHVTQPKWIML